MGDLRRGELSQSAEERDRRNSGAGKLAKDRGDSETTVQGRACGGTKTIWSLRSCHTRVKNLDDRSHFLLKSIIISYLI